MLSWVHLNGRDDKRICKVSESCWIEKFIYVYTYIIYVFIYICIINSIHMFIQINTSMVDFYITYA